MEIYKIIALGIIGAISVTVLKETGSSLYTYISIATGIIIIIISINFLYPVLIDFNELISKSKIEENTVVFLLKIIGIGYIAEYSASLCNELQCEAIGKKIIFAGKISIFVLAMPIIKQVFELLISII